MKGGGEEKMSPQGSYSESRLQATLNAEEVVHAIQNPQPHPFRKRTAFGNMAAL